MRPRHLAPLALLAGAALIGCSEESELPPSGNTPDVVRASGGADRAAEIYAERQKAAAGADAGDSSQATPVTLLRTPDGGFQPQAAVDAEGTVHLVYLKGEPAACDVYYARRPAGEEAFSQPLRVNSHPNSAIAVGTIRGAQLAVGKGGRVHVVWNGSKDAQPRGAGQKNDTPMLYARLDDEGTAFEPQRNLIHEAYGLDGGGTVAADALGNVYVAWHAGPHGKGEEERRVYVSVSGDEGRTFAPEVPASEPTTGVCGCCGMKAQADRSGTLRMLYRGAAGPNRDMYLLTSDDLGETFRSSRVSEWQVGTCPMSSASLSEGPAGIVAAWEKADEVYFGTVAGSEVERSVAPPAGGERHKHPSLAVNSRGETLLVWTEGTGWNKGGGVAWQVYSAAGLPIKERGRREGVPVWGLAAAVTDAGQGFLILH